MVLGQRTRNVAMLASALAALVSSLPGQPMRDQIRDIAVMIAEESADIADDIEDDSDGSLLPDDVRAA